MYRIPLKPSDATVIIAHDKDKKLVARARRSAVQIVNSEFILSGVLRQKVLVEEYPFFKHFSTIACLRSDGYFVTNLIVEITYCEFFSHMATCSSGKIENYKAQSHFR